MNSADIITVQDLDHMAKRYKVCDSDGREIGEKAGEAEYRKPVYDKYGRRRFDKWDSFESRNYKGKPPWFTAEVQGLEASSGVLKIIVRRRVNERG